MSKPYSKKGLISFHEAQKRLYPGIEIKEITFQVTEDCCLNCSYCYQHHKTKKKMTFEIAKTFIDELLADKIQGFTRNDIGGLSIDFIGGEPLLEIELIDQIWTYFIHQLIIQNHPWKNHIRGSLCSNGILYFDEKVQNFFKKYSSMFSFCISIDGNKELHDSCRVDFAGKGSYDKAIAAVKHYRENYEPLVQSKMTLAPDNIQFLFEAVKNLINEGYTDINLNCVYEKGWTWKHANILYNEMIKLSDYLIDNKLNEIIYVSLFEENYFIPLEESDNSNWCGGVDNHMLAISPDGEYYECIRYMESSLNGKQKPLCLGNIKDGYLSTEENYQVKEMLENVTRRSQSTDECFNCPIAKGCAWCSGYNYEEFGTPNKRATYICVMHKARALANIYYWNKIYKKYNIDKVFPNYLSNDDINQILQGGNLSE